MKHESKKFNYKLGTISQAPNWKSSEGKVLSYEPYIREMRIWAGLFQQVDIFAPLSSDEIRMTVSEYGFDNISFTFVPYSHTTAWWGALVRLLQLPGTLIRMTIFVLKHKVLLIRSPSHLGLYAHVLAFLFRKKTITKYAGYFGYFEGERMPSIVERNFILRILKPPHYVLVYGMAEASHLVSFIPAAISGAEIAALRALRSDRPPSGQKIIFYSLGKLIPVKNYSLAIHGLGLLYAEHPEYTWEYHIIGDGPEIDELTRLCGLYGISTRVIFEGKLSYESAMRKLVSADYLIMPGVKEGWPKVVIESWAVGAVPLVANAGILTHVIRDGENGFLFDPEPESLKKCLVKLFNNHTVISRIQNTGWKEVENFSIEEFAAKVESVCREKLQL